MKNDKKEMNKEFFSKYYKNNRVNENPSPFAVYCGEKYVDGSVSVLELGCGNGRDSLFFSKKGCEVLGLDLIEDEINFFKR